MNINIFQENQTKSKILVIGDIIVDHYVWGKVDRISPEAPIPTVLVNKKYSVLGGAGNVAANLAGLGCPVTLVGVSGDDEIGRELENLLELENIESFLPKIPGRNTTLKTRILSQNQQLLRIDEENIESIPENTQKKILGYLDEVLSNHSAVIVSDYGKGLITEDLCQELIEKCTKFSVTVFVDPKGKEWNKYRGAQGITPNDKEFAEYVNMSFKDDHDLTRHAQTVCVDLMIENLLVTRGAQGMLLVNREGPSEIIPAKAREVFDVSGAGDTVIAVLAMGVARGLSWGDAAKVANIAAGIVVSKIGTQPIQRDELLNNLRDPDGIRQKVVSLKTAKSLVQSWRQAGQKIVFTNGCFDLLHTGHIFLFQSAAKHGNRLVVGLNSDSSIRKIKGKDRPILSQIDRASILSALDSVDIVVIFEESTPLEMIKSLKPDVLVKGADYKTEDVIGHELVESWGGEVVLVQIINQISTSAIERKIRGE